MKTDNDFLGYQLDLVDALNAIDGTQPNERPRTVADAVYCFGRCVLFGFSTQVANIERLSREEVERAQSLFEHDIAEWSDMATELPQQWDATWQDDEASLLCQTILELRIDTWALELALRELRFQVSDSLRLSIEQFDRVLQEQRDILLIVVGSRWWDNQRKLIAAQRLDEAWWLNDTLSQSSAMVVREAVDSIPSKTQWSTIRSAALWNEVLPEMVGMAAATENSATTSRTVCWRSPCMTYQAVLFVPSRVTQAEVETPRSLFVIRVDDESLATDFAGKSFSLGTVRGTFDERATAMVRLVDVMKNCNGELRIGEPAIVWRIEVESQTTSHSDAS